MEAIRLPRALALGLIAVALAACASSPSPIITGRAGGQLPAAAWDPAAPPRVADARAHLQCVPYARRVSGVEIYGDAVTWWGQAAGRYPRSSTPAFGSVLVVEGYHNPSRGHVAVVRQIVSDRIVLVDHANWMNRGEISVGVPVLDVSPGNDWSQLRVWHIPGGHWGGRIYHAEGFIHPFSLRGLMS